MTNRVLITGMNGFVGRHIVKELSNKNVEIMGFDKGVNKFDNKKIQLKQVDLLDKDGLTKVVADYKPNYVIHLAAIASPVYGNVGELYDINVHGSENLLNAVRDNCDAGTRVVLTSTAGVYGNSGVDFDKEDETPYNPINHYSCSKMVMEYMSRHYKDDLDIKIVRPFNMIGVGQNTNFLVPKLVKAFVSKQPILSVGNMDTYRDFVDIDFASKFFCKLTLTQNTEYNVYNICAGHGTTGNEILGILKDLTGYSPKIEINPEFVRKNEIMRLVGDPTRCNKFINNEFKTKTVRAILTDMVKQY